MMRWSLYTQQRRMISHKELSHTDQNSATEKTNSVVPHFMPLCMPLYPFHASISTFFDIRCLDHERPTWLLYWTAMPDTHCACFITAGYVLCMLYYYRIRTVYALLMPDTYCACFITLSAGLSTLNKGVWVISRWSLELRRTENEICSCTLSFDVNTHKLLPK